jgi:hypothetical protein
VSRAAQSTERTSAGRSRGFALIQASSLRKLLQQFHSSDLACLLGTLLKDDPSGLGRIVRGPSGEFSRIVEHKDASLTERTIKEVNMSTYLFRAPDLLWALSKLENRNSQSEFYLTDCPQLLKEDQRKVDALAVLEPCESLSINTIEELSIVEAKNARIGLCHEVSSLGLRAPYHYPSLRLSMRDLKILSGRANPDLARDICNSLHLELGSVSLGKFPDGENYCKIDHDVRGRDVFLIQPTCPPVNDNLMELLIMIDSCKRASAARITAVIPYYGYARQDRKDEGRVPITAKLVANMIARAGADRVLTMDLHAPQIQGFFDVPVDHLYAAPVLNKYFEAMGYEQDEIVVVSPDEGSIKRAIGHSKRLGGKLAIVDKRPR